MPDVSPLNPSNFVYLDNNATTACLPEVVEAMAPYWQSVYGNAASTHYAGRCAYRALEAVRVAVADILRVKPYQLFFNSGATEGNNWIFNAYAGSKNERKRIVVSSVEHKSVLDAAKALEPYGYEIVVLPVSQGGVVSLEVAQQMITPEAGLVSVQLANNETGVIHPIRELVDLTHAVGAFFHCDAVQGLGKMAFSLEDLGVDSAVFSGHKIHAPKGVGLFYLRGGAARFPWVLPLHGGGQEQGIRPGTVNVAGVVGLGKAFGLLPDETELGRLQRLQNRLENDICLRIPGCRVHGQSTLRLPNTTNVSIPSIPSDILMANLPLFCVGEGSACNSGSLDSSYVLKAMGVPADEARCSIRVSTSTLTTELEIEAFLNQLCAKYKELKR